MRCPSRQKSARSTTSPASSPRRNCGTASPMSCTRRTGPRQRTDRARPRGRMCRGRRGGLSHGYEAPLPERCQRHLRPIGLLLIIMLAAMNCVAAETKSFGTLAETGQEQSRARNRRFSNCRLARHSIRESAGREPAMEGAAGSVVERPGAEYPSYGRPCSQGGNSIERELPIPEYLASRHQRTEASRVCVHSRRQQH